MTGREHMERAEDLAAHANLALTRDDDRAEAAALTALAQVHADLAHVAAITEWGASSAPAYPATGPYSGVPT